MNEILERAARAMCVDRDPDNADGGPHPSGIWLDPGEPWWTGYIGQARAVLGAIREPSEGMAREGGATGSWHEKIGMGLPLDDSSEEDGAAIVVWQRMIDAALAEESASDDAPFERVGKGHPLPG